jgi:hypothetical protein
MVPLLESLEEDEEDEDGGVMQYHCDPSLDELEQLPAVFVSTTMLPAVQSAIATPVPKMTLKGLQVKSVLFTLVVLSSGLVPVSVYTPSAKVSLNRTRPQQGAELVELLLLLESLLELLLSELLLSELHVGVSVATPGADAQAPAEFKDKTACEQQSFDVVVPS